MSAEPWEQRFRAPVSFLPEWSPFAPSRAVYASNESGSWQVHTLDADTGVTRQASNDALDGVPYGWSNGLAQAPGIVVAGIGDREGFAIHVSLDGAPARELYRSSEYVGPGGGENGGFPRGALSTDGTLLCLEHA